MDFLKEKNSYCFELPFFEDVGLILFICNININECDFIYLMKTWAKNKKKTTKKNKLLM